MKRMELYPKYAELIKRVAREKGDERSSKCGYDLFMGIVKGDSKKRYDAWIDYLKEVDSHTDEERDGVWVPAMSL